MNRREQLARPLTPSDDDAKLRLAVSRRHERKAAIPKAEPLGVVRMDPDE